MISQEDSNGTIFYLVDGLGSTRSIIDTNGVIIGEYNYDAYGQLVSQTGNISTDILFTGERVDAESGLVYLRARYYNPSNGRFLSVDPFGGFIDIPVTLHNYLYTNDNPVNFVDPSGEVGLFAVLFLSVIPVTIAIVDSIRVCEFGEDPLFGFLPPSDGAGGVSLYVQGLCSLFNLLAFDDDGIGRNLGGSAR